MSWYTFVLFLHIALVIVAFGVSFGYPIMFGLAAKEPAHSNFALRVSREQYRKVMLPLLVITPFLGLTLIFISPLDWDLWRSEWLVISISIYTAAFFFAALVQERTTERLIELTDGQPRGEDLPEIERLVKRSQIGGALLGLAVMVVLLMMVWKPGGQPLT